MRSPPDPPVWCHPGSLLPIRRHSTVSEGQSSYFHRMTHSSPQGRLPPRTASSADESWPDPETPLPRSPQMATPSFHGILPDTPAAPALSSHVPLSPGHPAYRPHWTFSGIHMECGKPAFHIHGWHLPLHPDTAAPALFPEGGLVSDKEIPAVT